MGLRKEKINEASRRCADVFSELGLTDEEIEIVHRVGWAAIKTELMEKEVEEMASDYIAQKKRTTLEKIVQVWPAIMSTLAIIISIISIVLKLMR